MKRFLIAIIATLVLGGGIWQAITTGAARVLAERAEVSGDANAADRAVKLDPQDAETHFARGQVLQSNEDFSGAALEFERAVQLRPRDYFLWLMLGVTRDNDQDQERALRALREAVRLAPAYASPRWQLGNLLLRAGRQDEAFAELRQAANANPTLYLNVIDLAWGTYGGNVVAAVDAIRPATEKARMALAIFFARHGQAEAALNEFRQTTTGPTKQSEDLLTALLEAKAFPEAYEVWRQARRPANGEVAALSGGIINAGFEEPIPMDEQGFDWQIARGVTNVTMSIDPSEHQSGQRSLRIEWRGDSNPDIPLMTQLVPVQPQMRYRLTFFVQTRDFVSAAAPVISVTDASDAKQNILGQSSALASAEKGWRPIVIEFASGPQTRAITLLLARQKCSQSPCPAFGVLWLDSFQLQ